ncbi:MAG: GGDEF domain-containing protein [Lachnospiraceae bacterium]
MQRLKQVSRDAIYTTIINCLLMVAVIIFLAIALTITMPEYGFDNEAVYEWKGTGTILVHGESQQIVSLPYSTDGKNGDVLVFSTILEQPNDRSNTLMFRSLHQKVKVYLDEELVLDYGNENGLLFGRTPGSQWQMIYLPVNYDGMKLTIEVETVYDHYGAALQKIYLGSKCSLLFMILRQNGGGLMIGIPVLIVSLALLAIGLVFESRNTSRRLYYLGLFSILAGMWIVLESRMVQFFSQTPLLYVQLVFIIFSLMPVPLIRFLMTSPAMKKSKYMKTIFWISVINFFMIQVLQITEIMDYLESVIFVHIVFVLITIGVLIAFVRGKIEGNLKDRWIFTSSFTFAAFGIIDLVRFYLSSDNTIDPLLCTKIGIAGFIFIIGIAGIRQISKEHAGVIEEETYKKLAFTDMMTGLGNRTAFEEKMDVFRKNKEKPLIALVDLNDLKSINDTFGHKCGDDAICRVGQLLSSFFKDKAQVYRIGGDEFCILSVDMKVEEAQAIFAQITEALRQQSKELEYQLMAAAGCVRTGEEGIDKAFVEADGLMYSNKKELKGKRNEKTT